MRVVLIILLSFLVINVHAQNNWVVKVKLTYGKDRGKLTAVDEKSITIVDEKGITTNLLLADIESIKIVKNTWVMVVGTYLGVTVFSGIGTVVGAKLASKGKAGEPAALSGLFGGIAGGLAGGIVGGVGVPLTYRAVTSRKIRMEHSEAFYKTLPDKLKPYLRK